MSDPIEVLDFWLGELQPKDWYAGGDDLDALIRDRFADLWQAAHDGGLEHWVESPPGALAYIIICDQFSRNIHRGKAESFATDPQARAAANKALEAGWDLEVPEPERQFFYMPFEHHENPDDQALALRLMQERMSSMPDMVLHARAHQEMIRRFGRFPLRNEALGRENTPEEQAFIEAGGYRTLLEELKSSHA